jgi:predicted outer membrane protein
VRPAAGLCLAVNTGPAQQTKAPALTNEQFVLLAGSAGMFEVKSSELAKDRASSDADLKSFAEKTLPTLPEHLKEAQALVNEVGGKER